MNKRELELAIAAGIATKADLSADPELTMEVKSQLPYYERMAATKLFKAPTDEQREQKILPMIFNVQVPDRVGDLLMSNPDDAKSWGGKGWVTDRFELAGGPYLHGHDHDFTVGQVLETAVELISTKEGMKWALVGNVKFLDNEVLPFSQADYLLAQAGFTASSVGYIPKVRAFVDDEELRAELGLDPWGQVQSTMELLEVSHVAVPANQLSAGAGKLLDEAVEEGMLSEALVSDYKSVRMVDPAERVRSKLRSTVVVGMKEVPVELECLDGVCSCKTRKDKGPDDSMVERLAQKGLDVLTDLAKAVQSVSGSVETSHQKLGDRLLSAMAIRSASQPDAAVPEGEDGSEKGDPEPTVQTVDADALARSIIEQLQGTNPPS